MIMILSMRTLFAVVDDGRCGWSADEVRQAKTVTAALAVLP
jgi:hypothetical protein